MRKLPFFIAMLLVTAIVVGCKSSDTIDPKDPGLKKNIGKPGVSAG